jgi:hypothetical protein
MMLAGGWPAAVPLDTISVPLAAFARHGYDGPLVALDSASQGYNNKLVRTKHFFYYCLGIN